MQVTVDTSTGENLAFSLPPFSTLAEIFHLVDDSVPFCLSMKSDGA